MFAAENASMLSDFSNGLHATLVRQATVAQVYAMQAWVLQQAADL